MRRGVRLTLLVVVGLAAVTATAAAQDGGACGFPYEAPDGTVIDEEPDRVIPGIASISQTLWEIGAQDKVVGLTSNSFYLEGSEGYTDIGTGFDSGFAENIIAQDPDIVINTLYEQDGLEETLESAGIDYYYAPTAGSIRDIQENTETVGRLIGECDAAEEVVEAMRSDVERVESAVDGRASPTVLYSIPQRAFSVPGNGTFIGSLIETAGGKNAYAEAGLEGFTQISDETAVQIITEQDPDWIVLPGGGPDDVPDTELYNATTAVEEGQVLTVNPNYILQDGPRVVVPLKRMARAFHPDGFEDGGGDGGGEGIVVPEEPVAENGSFAESLSAVGNASRADFGSGPVDSVEVGVVIEGEVSVRSLSAEGAPGAALRRFSVTVPEGARDSAGRLRLSVNDSAVEEAGVAREDLLVVRLDGGPTPLNTTALDTETGVTLVADTPGFSEFAVVGSSPPIARADGSVEDGSVTLSAAGSYDEYGDVVGYAWETDGSTYEGETVEVDGGGEATLTVTNDAGLTNSTTVRIPEVEGNETETSGERVSGGNDDGSDGEGDGADGNDTADEDGSEGEATPGFTAVVALVAVVAAAFARR